jgi:hypothetical protein
VSQPIPVRVTRYACPHCPRTHSSRQRAVAHMGRCWYNPAAKGCKTCEYFMPAEHADYVSGYPGADEYCMRGVGLTGRPSCATCAGGGSVIDGATLGVSECPTCGGDAAAVKPGPIVGCPEWSPSSSLPTERS